MPTLSPIQSRSEEHAGDEDALWTAWRIERTPATRESLVLRHLPYAKSVATRMYRARPYLGVEYGDFYQFACIGLLESIERFDPDRGVGFRTFALSRIEGCIVSGVQRLTELSEQMSLRRRIQRDRLASLKGDSGRLATRPANRLLAELSEIAVGLAIGLMLEETAMYRAEDDEAARDTAYATIAWRQSRERVLAAVRVLPDRQRQVVVLHYLHGLSFEHIGAVLQLTKGRISQLHRDGLLELRVRLGPVERFSLVR